MAAEKYGICAYSNTLSTPTVPKDCLVSKASDRKLFGELKRRYEEFLNPVAQVEESVGALLRIIQSNNVARRNQPSLMTVMI